MAQPDQKQKPKAKTPPGYRVLSTEKAARLGRQVFAVPPETNKPLVRAAIKKTYGITPQRINIINVRGKKILVRGKPGRRPGLKKAIIYLKPGEKFALA